LSRVLNFTKNFYLKNRVINEVKTMHKNMKRVHGKNPFPLWESEMMKKVTIKNCF